MDDVIKPFYYTKLKFNFWTVYIFLSETATLKILALSTEGTLQEMWISI